MNRGGGGASCTPGWGWKAGLKASAWWVSPQPRQNITYLGAQRLEARQGADRHSLVIHAAALGIGQHVHEAVHLGCRAALCVETRPWGAQPSWSPPAHPATPNSHPPRSMLVSAPNPWASLSPVTGSLSQTLSHRPPRWPLAPFMPDHPHHSHFCTPCCPLSRLSEAGPGPACSEQRCSSIRPPCTWLSRLKKPSWSGEPAWGTDRLSPAGPQPGDPSTQSASFHLAPGPALSFSVALTMVPADVLLCRAAPNET